jgi:tyrosyl-tRNA synthetase
MKKPDEILTRRVEKVLPNKEALQKLMESKKLRLYQGFDPTGGRLHLGHSIGIRKLMEFANAGHEVIFLFGTGTALAGDPSQRDTGRKLITAEEIEENIGGWKEQVSPLVDWGKVQILENGNWLTKLNLKDIIGIASNISATQLFKRDMFQRRLSKGDTVWYHETLYPLLQGYDSVEMDVDLEIGGTDQEFNMLIGRELMQKMKGKEKYVLTTPMILGTDGKQMSKSSGNCIWLNDTPVDMYRKVMEVVDSQIDTYMTLLTDIPTNRISEVLSKVKDGSMHPIDAKKELANAVVSQLHSKEDAESARKTFEKNYQSDNSQSKDYFMQIPLGQNSAGTIAPFTPNKSMSDAKRLISQGGVQVNGEKITDPSYKFKVGEKVQIGKNIFGTITENAN